MNTLRPNAQTQIDLAEDHLHLRNLLARAARCLAQRDLAPAEVLQMFDGLRGELLDHFRHEEDGGYFGEAIAIAPRLKSRADALLEQHPGLEQHLDRLRKLAERGQSTDRWWQSLAEDFASFYAAFDQHERAETALLQEAYTQDVGDKD